MKQYKKTLSYLLCGFLVIGIQACTQPGTKTGVGAGTGAVIGAGLGAIIGSATGDAGPGIAIGGGSGALIGGMIGNAMDKQDNQTQAQQDTLNRQQAQIEENQRLINELRSRGADARQSERGVVIHLPDILFDFDRSTLTVEAAQTMREIGGVLVDVRDRHISIEGHTDSIGTMIYNQGLSEDRAQRVYRELKDNGIPAGQMSHVGYGEGRPIATNNTAAGRTRNRRVEIIVEN